MAEPCPCGSEIKPGQAQIAYITQEILDGAQAVAPVRIMSLLDSLYGRAFNVTALCLEPPPRPPESLPDWYENPVAFLNDILAAVLSISWNLWCQCSTCPPVTGCGTGVAFSLSEGDAYCPVSAQVPPPDSCAPCQVWYYVLDDAATYYVERSDGHCYGPFTGLEVRWPCVTFAPPGYVTVANGDGSGPQNWLTSLYGTSMTIWTGGAGGGAPAWVWENGVATVELEPQAPACDDTTICTAVDYVRDRVQVLERLVVAALQQLDIVNQPTSIKIPGGGGVLTGTISELLGPALRYLLPIDPIQLTDPTVTVVTADSLVDVTNLQYVNIVPTVIPGNMGSRGSGENQIYYSNARNEGPAEILLLGQAGVLEVFQCVYPSGVEFAIPSTATGLAIRLAPGVEIEVTTWERNV